ncbi:endolytic transglycosylase MltG [Candidatus Saccharibacteria bacterium]|nr:endolytic transglycosylase MltG [Candidatus Saccharibacteria bacterium]
MRDDIRSPVGPERPSAGPDSPPLAAQSPVNLSELPTPAIHEQSEQKLAPKKRMIAIILGIIVLVLGVVIVACGFWYARQLQPVDVNSNDKTKITIAAGAGLSDIAETLKKQNLIRSKLAFELYVRQSGKTSSLQSGSYRLSQSEGVPAIVKHLTSGNADTFTITFLPGATLDKHRQAFLDAGYAPEQVDAALEKQYDHPLFESKPESADLEGYIYGETFNFAADATPEEILVYNFDYFRDIIDTNNLVELYKKQGFSLFEGITMASIIQREVAAPEDAAQVAQVFKTRYDMGMKLGSDVTYQYIADKLGQPRSVDFDSPYNTRRYAGLPPGPISSPGLATLQAVGNPAPGDYIYFLSGDDDKTYFARTNEEHERNIQAHCQKKCQII